MKRLITGLLLGLLTLVSFDSYAGVNSSTRWYTDADGCSVTEIITTTWDVCCNGQIKYNITSTLHVFTDCGGLVVETKFTVDALTNAEGEVTGFDPASIVVITGDLADITGYFNNLDNQNYWISNENMTGINDY